MAEQENYHGGSRFEEQWMLWAQNCDFIKEST
jgi:hypothetical protein